MNYQISEQRLEEQKVENRFRSAVTYPGISSAPMTEYFGEVGLFAMKINGNIFACDP